ncbi:MAG: hypothetical protein GY856_02290 [bacterium]|nr:hypothetical protein [bacterium]
MRHVTRNPWIFGIILLALVTACVPRVPPPVIVPPEMPTGGELELQQEMLVLAYITYAGELLKGSDDQVGRELVPCVRKELDTQPLTAGLWDLVWGPVVYKFELATLDDNMMFVARHRKDRSRLVVATRGTNAKAILDWVLEDSDVAAMEEWSYGDAPKGARIARGTHTGLEALLGMQPASGVPPEGDKWEVPGAEKTLRKFLAQQVRDEGVTRVDVTGHSLGGVLAPTLTLWLADTRGQWDPKNKVALSVIAFAGPTAGNGAFASYSDRRIGDTTHRVHNPFDIVPMAWNLSTLEAIPDVYQEGGIKAPEDVKLLLDAVVLLVKESDYTQIRADAPPLPGKINPAPDLDDFLKQMPWQHVERYLEDLKISDRFHKVSPDCSD